MSIKDIREQYKVPARVGGRVIYHSTRGPKRGTITGAKDGFVLVMIDGEGLALPHHPKWKLEYLEEKT